ncbi:hypothetical protein FNF31_00172 [Cafeteria roenbergensis]|uniref:Uncharacterized protein n=1 Tax=Cafeteria roenbergensis TaxID=33653 RepID=A0A5A8DU43_CAFRO|nr:hypothetical protein FNF31_00172 [Cafeteria roenbergensis]
MSWARQGVLALVAVGFAVWRISTLEQGGAGPPRAGLLATIPRVDDIQTVLFSHIDMFRHELVEGLSHRGEARLFLTRTRVGAAPRIVLSLTLAPRHSIEAEATAQLRGSAPASAPLLLYDRGLVFKRPARHSARQRTSGGRPAAASKSTGFFGLLLNLAGVASGGSGSRPSRDPADVVVVADGFPMEYADSDPADAAEAAAAISRAWGRVPGTGSLPVSGPGADAASLRRALRAAAGAGLLVWRGASEADVDAVMPGGLPRGRPASLEQGHAGAGHRSSAAGRDGGGSRRVAMSSHGDEGQGRSAAAARQTPQPGQPQQSAAEVDAASADVELQ